MKIKPTPQLTSTLCELRGQKCHFFANTGNAGDGLIAHATHALLASHSIDAVPYSHDMDLAGATLLIGGGGNLVEGLYTDVAEVLAKNLPGNRCILLPHTVSGFHSLIAHPNLTLFCRENISFQLALAAGAKDAHLAHDLAFSLPEELTSLAADRQGSGTLFALRRDGESEYRLPIPNDNIDLSKTWEHKFWNDPFLCRAVSESLVAYISLFESVVTDRLHVAILAALINRQVTMLPNSYFKNKAVFEHSIAPYFTNVRFIKGQDYAYEMRTADQAEEASRLRVTIDDLRNEVRALKGSRSWRITAPLRKVTDALRSSGKRR